MPWRFLSVVGSVLSCPVACGSWWRYTYRMTRTYRKVRYSPKSKGKEYTPVTAAQDVEQAFKVLEGRWKLLILFHLFGGKVLRISELERGIPAISQKMLIQQLRQMEND